MFVNVAVPRVETGRMTVKCSGVVRPRAVAISDQEKRANHLDQPSNNIV